MFPIPNLDLSALQDGDTPATDEDIAKVGEWVESFNDRAEFYAWLKREYEIWVSYQLELRNQDNS